jgi:hypothetical protein
MKRIALIFALTVSILAAQAQNHYSGSMGYVVSQHIEIDVNMGTGWFSGLAWVAPAATPYTISGRLVHGHFWIPGVIDTPVIWDWWKIQGVGVDLWHSSKPIRKK